MTDKIKIKFLTAIWGARYIEEFARVSLPSYLAPGNLPIVAAENDLEVLILTTSESRATFDEMPIFGRLAELCTVRYLLIDDLITSGNYGVTLTLAYARGIQDSGEAQTETTFVFMNSDFVLADGSLRGMVDKLREGHRCVMAPSLRARAEITLPLLADAVDPVTETLVMSPRDMVRLTFDHLHPTVIAKTATQNFVTCSTHNQIYWQVDRNTLLARYHLIFMLAIRPEVPMPAVNSYCDYGFVPELVPSGEFTIMDDSDDFYMLELQPSWQEKQFVHCGSSTPDKIASELSVWTTREHRRFAGVDIVFRTGEIPANLPAAREKMGAFVADIHKRMAPAVTHVDHFYWVMGLQAWRSLRDAVSAAGSAGPNELAPVDAHSDTPGNVPVVKPRIRLRSRIKSWAMRQYVALIARVRVLAGTKPNVAVWHHTWLDCRLVLNWLSAVGRRRPTRNLLLSDPDSALANAFSEQGGFQVEQGIQRFIDGYRELDPAGRAEVKGRYDNVLVHTTRASVRSTADALQIVANYVAPGGSIAVYIEHVNGEVDPSNFSIELAQYAEEVLPPSWIGYDIEAQFVGGTAKRRLRLMERRLFRHLTPSSVWRLPVLVAAVGLWPVVAAMTAINNFRHRDIGGVCPEFCSSALLTLRASDGGAEGARPSV